MEKFRVEVAGTASISHRLFFLWVIQVSVLTGFSWLGITRCGLFELGDSWTFNTNYPLLFFVQILECLSILFAFSTASFRILGLLLFIFEWALFLSDAVNTGLLYILLPLPLIFSPFWSNMTGYNALINLPLVGGLIGTLCPKTNKTDVVLYYDEECMMCSALLVFLSKRQLPDNLQFAGLKSQSFLNLKKDCSFLEGLDTLVVIARNDSLATVRIKSRAIFWMTGQLPSWTKITLIFMILPTLWSDWFYDLVAKYRKRFQKSGSCPVIPQSISQRLIP